MIDFSRYDKGLRLYATLYKLDPDVFNTNSFINIKHNKRELKLLYSKLYDDYIKKLLENNIYYYNTIIEKVNNKPYVVYVFIYKSNDISDNITCNCLDQNSNILITDEFYIKTCIHWKKYLDDTFIQLCSCNYGQTKKVCKKLQTFYLFDNLSFVVSTLTW